MQEAFQIELNDNVATALNPLVPGELKLNGNSEKKSIQVIEDVPIGHKVAVKDIAEGESILKYGVVIGCATKDIKCGQWVHLHCMRSMYDERSSHLDIYTGAPKDIKYE